MLAAALAALISPSSRAQVTLVLSNKWSIPQDGTRPYLPAGTPGWPRGVAINRLTGNVLIPTTNPSNSVWVVNGADGSDLGQFQFPSAAITSGNLALMKLGVADDGVVYACNLSVPGATFKIYRWDAEDTVNPNPPYVAFGPASTGSDPMRIGDSFAVRGAGTNTQILASGGNSGSIQSTNFVLFTTADGTNFVPTQFRLPAGVPAGAASRTVAFDGTNNAFYASTLNASTVYRIGFDLATTNATLLGTISLSPPAGMGRVAATNGFTLYAGIQDGGGATHRLEVFDISNPAVPTLAVGGDVPFPPPNAVNGNATGDTDIGNGMVVALDSNNGLLALSLHFLSNVPPTFSAEPQDTAVLQTGTATFTAVVQGTTPFSYAWFFNTNTLVASGTTLASTLTLSITNAQPTHAGYYRVAVTNAGGASTSSNALLTVIPGVFTKLQSPLWTVAPGSRPYLGTSDYGTRGLAFNPVTDRLLLASKATTNVYVLNAATGADLWTLDTSGILGVGAPGTFALNLVGVAEDGAVYAGNLSVSGDDYTLYRWPADTPDPSTNLAAVAWSALIYGNLGIGRLGDTLAVRGAGADTQILIGSANAAKVALLTTADGQNFTATVLDFSADPNVPTGFAGLGIAFGAGDTFWAKNAGYNLRRAAYDAGAGTGTILNAFTGLPQVGAIAWDTANDLLAGVAVENPDNLRLYDLLDLAAGPSLLDQDFFPANNANVQVNGAAAFDVAGGRLFALDVNNGLLAMKYGPRLKRSGTGNAQTFSWTGPGALQTASTVAGTYNDVPAASSPFTTNITSGPLFFRVRR